jgi:hypothetical protein
MRSGETGRAGAVVRRPVHFIADSIGRRNEATKAVIIALAGLLVASAVAIGGDWLTLELAGARFLRADSTGGLVLILIAFLWTAGSVVLGGFVVSRLGGTRATLSGFMILELFFGAGLVGEFWTPAVSWYDTVALLLVIPCALLGATLARSRGSSRTTSVG